MKYTEIADELVANAAALSDEVSSLSTVFSETAFLGDNKNFAHAHYGYLMACMGQIDLMSKCEWGPDEPPRNQTPRMQNFMDRYLDATKADEHRVAIQLMRHTLMHTGSLRFLYDEQTETGYTWRIHFGNTLPKPYRHYTLTPEDPKHQQVLQAAVNGTVTEVRALNVQLTAFAADIARTAGEYTAAMTRDAILQSKCEGVFPAIRVQKLRMPQPVDDQRE